MVWYFQEAAAMHQPGLFDPADHLKLLSETGDPLEALERHADFEAFRPVLREALDQGERPKGGRSPCDPVAMSEILVLASTHNPGDERMEFPVRDRFTWLRFPEFRFGAPTPDAKTIWLFRENLVRAGASETLFAAFEKQPRDRGHAPGGGQIVDSTLVSAPRQRTAGEERDRAKAGEGASGIWPDEPTRAARKDTDARWAIRYSKAKKAEKNKDSGKPEDAKGGGPVDISVLHFGYKNHVGTDGKHGFVRGETCTDATRHDGHEPESVLDKDNSSKVVWADTACRSAENEAWPEENGQRSQIHHGKPRWPSPCRGTSGAPIRSDPPCAPAPGTCPATGRGRWPSRSARSSGRARPVE